MSAGSGFLAFLPGYLLAPSSSISWGPSRESLDASSLDTSSFPGGKLGPSLNLCRPDEDFKEITSFEASSSDGLVAGAVSSRESLLSARVGLDLGVETAG